MPEPEKPLPWYKVALIIALMMVIGYVCLRTLVTTVPTV